LKACDREHSAIPEVPLHRWQAQQAGVVEVPARLFERQVLQFQRQGHQSADLLLPRLGLDYLPLERGFQFFRKRLSPQNENH